MIVPQKCVVVAGIGYVLLIATLFIGGGGELAALLTYPAWLLIGGLAVVTTLIPGLDRVVFSWTGNLLLLVLSAATNAATVYALVTAWRDR